MKKIICLALILCMTLCGCSWMEGEYHSVTPHAGEGIPQSQDGIVVTSYLQIREALQEMVNAGATEAVLYATQINTEMVEQYMQTAVTHLHKNTAIGAYALREITYEIGTQAEHYAVAVDIDYVHGRQEIMRIKSAPDMKRLKNRVNEALNTCSNTLVVKVDQYEELDLVQYVQDFVDRNSHMCMEIPQTSVMVYPESGDERIIEMSFTYETSRDTLRSMQESVAPIFSAAKLYVQGSENDLQKYSQLCSFLIERFEYQYETSITPTYSLLRYGVGDCKAFARVYSNMCQNAGLQCSVVSGTRNGEAWYWNQIKIDDVYYHVDLLANTETGEFTPRLSEEMSGYVWDYSMYP